jgi:hypothetical protein
LILPPLAVRGGEAMLLSMWTYPWDVLDLGLDTVAGELRDRAGLNGISLATSYHAGRFLQPRSPRRKAYFPEDGTIYFHPTAARWDNAAIRPKVADLLASGDVLGELVRNRERIGLAVQCWTVCLHNTRLGMLHPHACTRNAFGDANFYSLCPSHPDARDYAVNLVADLTTTYQPDIVELETIGFMGFAHEYHHEKDGVGLTAEDDFLLSLCFCDSCLTRAAAAGVDGAAARCTVRGWIVEACERPLPVPRWPDFIARGPEAFAATPDVEAYVRWRFEPVTSLAAAIREQADPASQIHVLDIDDGWLSGCNLRELAGATDGVTLCVYARPPDAVAAGVAKARAALPPGRSLRAGLRVFHPEVSSAEDVAARARAAIDAGASGVNFYNYGLIPAARLDWVRAASDAVRR